jgi:hypothetical protein
MRIALVMAFAALGTGLLVPLSSSRSAVATASTCGWLGGIQGSGAQNQPIVLSIPPSFARANLLIALSADDGPDGATPPNSSAFGGTSGLTWTRIGRDSSRTSVALPGDTLEATGASTTEAWQAIPPPGWRGTGTTITEIGNHPTTPDDGHVVSVSAYTNGMVSRTVNGDGLGGPGAAITTIGSVPAGSAVYTAIMEGRVNAAFTPTIGSHTAVQRRAGDDTMSVVASDARALPAGMFTTGQVGDPGPYWEETGVVVGPGS